MDMLIKQVCFNLLFISCLCPNNLLFDDLDMFLCGLMELKLKKEEISSVTFLLRTIQADIYNLPGFY